MIVLISTVNSAWRILLQASERSTPNKIGEPRYLGGLCVSLAATRDLD